MTKKIIAGEALRRGMAYMTDILPVAARVDNCRRADAAIGVVWIYAMSSTPKRR
jgi:hypothetical protein